MADENQADHISNMTDIAVGYIRKGMFFDAFKVCNRELVHAYVCHSANIVSSPGQRAFHGGGRVSP